MKIERIRSIDGRQLVQTIHLSITDARIREQYAICFGRGKKGGREPSSAPSCPAMKSPNMGRVLRTLADPRVPTSPFVRPLAHWRVFDINTGVL